MGTATQTHRALGDTQALVMMRAFFASLLLVLAVGCDPLPAGADACVSCHSGIEQV